MMMPIGLLCYSAICTVYIWISLKITIIHIIKIKNKNKKPHKIGACRSQINFIPFEAWRSSILIFIYTCRLCKSAIHYVRIACSPMQQCACVCMCLCVWAPQASSLFVVIHLLVSNRDIDAVIQLPAFVIPNHKIFTCTEFAQENGN